MQPSLSMQTFILNKTQILHAAEAVHKRIHQKRDQINTIIVKCVLPKIDMLSYFKKYNDELQSVAFLLLCSKIQLVIHEANNSILLHT